MGEPAALSEADRAEMRELATEIVTGVEDDTGVPLVVLVDHDPNNINGTVLRLAQLVREQADMIELRDEEIERLAKSAPEVPF